MLAAPLLGGLAIGAGAVVAGLGLVALPFYGGYRLHKKLRRRKNMKLFLSMPSVALHDFHPQCTDGYYCIFLCIYWYSLPGVAICAKFWLFNQRLIEEGFRHRSISVGICNQVKSC